ncbi:exodeoxyribonuclease III [Ligilactobacillus salitolerans]|uniref:Exodeoxyribonuclease n=1 Tax=Ligilactobacillus salitolerans TaxID=1808352 RepID=A0A401ITI4_9LACO|nr:exodeoxyribonuclease III [Ligilactobacillus salitolerans]GBG94829.1 exodeoxyribonuclease III [Ligilactobacillus salitolerans]
MKLISWNIDSVNAALTSDSARAQLTREVLKTIHSYEPDVIAIQETKLSAKGPTKKHLAALDELFPEYALAWRSSEEPARKSYAGTMFLYKKELTPVVTAPEIGAPAPMDQEGRILTLEFDNCYVTEVYTPNSGNELVRLSDRQIWDQKYQEYLLSLDQKKPVISSGDFNVAHTEIDLKHPATNHHSAGFTDEERADFTKLLASGFSDSFRLIHGDVKGAYSWWAQRVKTSKINNSGWRIDYYLVSERIKDQVVKSEMVDSGTRQDHTPIYLELDL